MRLDVFLASVPIAPLAWLLSWRRTPWAAPWFCGALVMALWSLLAFVWPHVTAVGDAAATGVPLAVVALGCTFFIEGFATGSTDSVNQWRRVRSRGSRPGSWEIVTKAAKLGNGKETVMVGVRVADKTRWIGEADPVSEMDAFMTLRAEAEQARETLNALKVSV